MSAEGEDFVDQPGWAVDQEHQMERILEEMGFPEEVIQTFKREKVYIPTVKLLTDDQLKELGIKLVGERAELRRRCQQSEHGMSVEKEVRSVMGILPRSVYSVTSRAISSSSQIPRHPTKKTKLRLAEEKYGRPAKKLKLEAKPTPTFQKKIVIFKYMGCDAPTHFTRKESNIIMRGILPDIPLTASESRMRQEISEVIQTCSDQDLRFCSPEDFEFINVSGKHASVPNHKPGFAFTASAVRKLAGAGCVYVRLIRKFGYSSSSDSDDLPTVSLKQGHDDDVTVVKVEPPPTTMTSSSEMLQSSGSVPACKDDRTPFEDASGGGQCSSVQCQSPGDSYTAVECESMPEQNTLEQLLGIFVDTGKFSERQVRTVFDLSDCDFEKTMECLLEGPTIQGLVRLHQMLFCGKPATKFYIDSDDLWPDMVGYYKTGVNTSKPIKVILDEQPAIDTGGVRRQVFSDVFTLFANNKHFRLFEGEPCSLRPVHSANCRSSGLLKVFGTMVAHSIAQDGVGFPYLSPLSYWYIAAGEVESLQHIGLSDVGTDVADVITKLNDTRTEETLQGIMSQDYVLDILQRAGVTTPLTMSTKDSVAQDVMTYEGLYKVAPFLDQIATGLRSGGLLQSIQSYPLLFAPLFMNTGEVTVDDVLQAIYVDEDETEMRPPEHIAIGFLQRFVTESDTTRLKTLLRHITGAEIAMKKDIRVDFMDDDNGAIVAHTCSRLIILPRGTFTVDSNDAYQTFSIALEAVLSGKGFNTM